jgi:hypothetical protein
MGNSKDGPSALDNRPLGRAPTGSFVILIASTKDQSAPINSHVFHHKGGLGAGSYKGIVGALPKRAIPVSPQDA